MFLYDILIHDDKLHLTLITVGFLEVRFGVVGESWSLSKTS